MKFLRYLVGFPVAVIVTSLLFLLMYHLIRQEQLPLPPGLQDDLDFIMPIPDETDPPEPKPEPEPDPIEPPDTIIDTEGFRPGDPTPIDPGPKPGPGPFPIGPTGGGGPVITPTGFYPVLQSLPAYPANCAAREIEGEVTVEYDVTNGGQVINARVIESADSCLDKAALRAIEGWKYSPLSDADPDGIRKRGLQKTFEFKLEE